MPAGPTRGRRIGRRMRRRSARRRAGRAGLAVRIRRPGDSPKLVETCVLFEICACHPYARVVLRSRWRRRSALRHFFSLQPEHSPGFRRPATERSQTWQRQDRKGAVLLLLPDRLRPGASFTCGVPSTEVHGRQVRVPHAGEGQQSDDERAVGHRGPQPRHLGAGPRAPDSIGAFEACSGCFRSFGDGFRAF